MATNEKRKSGSARRCGHDGWGRARTLALGLLALFAGIGLTPLARAQQVEEMEASEPVDAADQGKALSAITTKLCPKRNTFTKELDPHHYYYTGKANDDAPNRCNSCEDPKNNKSGACSAYRSLQKCGINDTKRCVTDHGDQANIYAKPNLRYALVQEDGSASCHFVVYAIDPVIGVEDVNHRGSQNFWEQAYFASQKIIAPRVPVAELGMAINPASKRGQHQLHIHIGRLKAGYRAAMEKIKRDNSFYPVTIGNTDFSAIWLKDSAISGHSPFEVVSKMYGESDMPQEGIIVARSKDDKGTYVLAGVDIVAERQLDFGGKCAFPKP